MNRIQTLMKLELFTNVEFRKPLKKFIQTYLHDDELLVDINQIIPAMYDEKNNINNTIEASILNSKLYVGFEHDTDDAVLQRLIFYSLIFSFDQYPTQEDWNSFLELPLDEKMSKTQEGISLIASTLLAKDLEKKLLTEFDVLPD